MAMSETCKSTILSAMTGKANYASIASTCFIGLLKSITTSSENGTIFLEPETSAGYGRTQLGQYQNEPGQLMGAPTNGKITNRQIVYFPEATADWGTVNYFALYTSASGGSPFLWGALSEPVNIPSGYVPLFRVGKLVISIE
ncbi:MAG: hypothetical protein ACI4LP_05220 [Anaerovoracaceae bacterium]